MIAGFLFFCETGPASHNSPLNAYIRVFVPIEGAGGSIF